MLWAERKIIIIAGRKQAKQEKKQRETIWRNREKEKEKVIMQ